MDKISQKNDTDVWLYYADGRIDSLPMAEFDRLFTLVIKVSDKDKT